MLRFRKNVKQGLIFLVVMGPGGSLTVQNNAVSVFLGGGDFQSPDDRKNVLVKVGRLRIGSQP